MSVLNLVDYHLCSIDDVRSIMASKGARIDSDFQYLAELLINHFTVGAEWLTQRKFRIEERTEYHDGGDGVIALEAPPIDDTGDPLVPLITVYEDSERQFGANTELTVWEDYIIQNRTNGAHLHRRWQDWICDPRAVKVVYTGGIVTPASGDDQDYTPPDAPYDLSTACAMQVAAWYQRKGELNVSGLSLPGMGSVSIMEDPTRLLREVRDVLTRYRIYR